MNNPIWYLIDYTAIFIDGEEIYTGFFTDRVGNVAWFTCVYDKSKTMSSIIAHSGFKK